MIDFIPVNNTRLDMFYIGQRILILTNNGEELKSTVQIIRHIHPLGRREVILLLDKPYTLYRHDDNYEFYGDKDPVSVAASQPSININRTVLFYYSTNRYMFYTDESDRFFHSFIRYMRII